MASGIATQEGRFSRSDGAVRGAALPNAERARASNYPLSRYWLRPWAGTLAAGLARTSVRPVHLTLWGAGAGGVAAAVICFRSDQPGWAAPLVLLAWFFDRADGQLARLQNRASPWGAWLDANVDELVDILLHVAVAWAAAQSGSMWAWPGLLGFVVGKYLLMVGLLLEDAHRAEYADNGTAGVASQDGLDRWPGRLNGRVCSWLRSAYHWPGNADVRVHLLALALLTGWLTAELLFVALYYNLRWAARYGLMAYKLRAA